MSQALEQAQNALLAPANLDTTQLNKTLQYLMKPGVDYADLFFQIKQREAWALEDGIVRNAAASSAQGVGVRALAGEQSGFAFADQLTPAALTQASQAAAAIAQSGHNQPVNALARSDQDLPARYSPVNPTHSLDAGAKVALLHRANKIARDADSRVTRVNVSLSGSHESMLVAASDGTLAGDIRPLVRFNVTVFVAHNGRRESASAGGGARADYLWFTQSIDRVDEYAREAVRRALIKLHAKPAPAGKMPVVLGPGWPGVLLHEAVGHGLEGDFNRRGSSNYSRKLGQMVASPLCTIVDDGTLNGRRGSLTIDDEGTPTACNTLIKQGRLVGYMQDKHNARLMGMKPTGNARRQSYAHTTMPRMTNTYMQPGKDNPKDILSSLQDGVYAVNFSGGSVDITSGNFVFSADEAYEVKNGRIGDPLKGATLIGNGPEVLNQVSMVGHDLALDSGVGVCGKHGQSVPVGVGQPTLRLDSITVGGTHS